MPLQNFIDIPDLPAGEIQWTDATCDDTHPGHKLVASISIAGCPMCLEAHEVLYTEHGMQEFRALEDDLVAIHEATSMDGPWQTVRIQDREYVLIATPVAL
jgi:hypothetical protein